MKSSLSLLLLLISPFVHSQSFPEAFYVTDNNLLQRGGAASEGFYDESTIDSIYFSDAR